MATDKKQRFSFDGLRLVQKGKSKNGSPVLQIEGGVERKLGGKDQWLRMPFGVQVEPEKKNVQLAVECDGEHAEFFKQLDAWAREQAAELLDGAEWQSVLKQSDDYPPYVRCSAWFSNVTVGVAVDKKFQRPGSQDLVASFLKDQNLGKGTQACLTVKPTAVWVSQGKAGLRLVVPELWMKRGAPPERELAFDPDDLL
jgi:hypothetical protein